MVKMTKPQIYKAQSAPGTRKMNDPVKQMITTLLRTEGGEKNSPRSKGIFHTRDHRGGSMCDGRFLLDDK